MENPGPGAYALLLLLLARLTVTSTAYVVAGCVCHAALTRCSRGRPQSEARRCVAVVSARC